VAISSSANAIEIEMPAVGLSGVPMDYAVTGLSPSETVDITLGDQRFSVNADEDGRAEINDIVIDVAGQTQFLVTAGGASAEVSIRVVPAWI